MSAEKPTKPTGRGRGGVRKWLTEPSTKENWMCQRITWLMSPATGHAHAKDSWPQALKALLVVNSFKLHLNAFLACYTIHFRIFSFSLQKNPKNPKNPILDYPEEIKCTPSLDLKFTIHEPPTAKSRLYKLTFARKAAFFFFSSIWSFLSLAFSSTCGTRHELINHKIHVTWIMCNKHTSSR